MGRGAAGGAATGFGAMGAGLGGAATGRGDAGGGAAGLGGSGNRTGRRWCRPRRCSDRPRRGGRRLRRCGGGFRRRRCGSRFCRGLFLGIDRRCLGLRDVCRHRQHDRNSRQQSERWDEGPGEQKTLELHGDPRCARIRAVPIHTLPYQPRQSITRSMPRRICGSKLSNRSCCGAITHWRVTLNGNAVNGSPPPKFLRNRSTVAPKNSYMVRGCGWEVCR